jgi:hypothetical protein
MFLLLYERCLSWAFALYEGHPKNKLFLSLKSIRKTADKGDNWEKANHKESC